ncbi:unnamed protein product [Vitrella brassicaformis CCMP3155]|uniref:Major facilitator superfamily (MFS) profile domain-containing protein n=3 Tax=Vitrella brassicaformis TaxID=1169539 RepID=A0A0G4FPT7_VITBC|nr:unnamed protein product [Vitrella brassicaformis CCMP3155]|eukprot:CEM16454.1 unnamed protein product [Vitrella brassicaformis CCMP3155]
MPMVVQPRLWLLVGCALHYFFSTGCYLGWAAMINILKGEALYRHLCEPSLSLANPEEAALLLRHESCSAEDVRLNLMFVVMSALGMCATLPLGFLIDRLPKCLWVYQLLIACGPALVGMGTLMPHVQRHVDLIFIGFCLLVLPGGAVSFVHFHVANLFMNSFAIVMTILSSAYGFSAFLFPVFHALWANTSMRLTHIAFGYAAILFAFVPFCLVQPAARSEAGDRVGFEWRKGGFYLTADTPQEQREQKSHEEQPQTDDPNQVGDCHGQPSSDRCGVESCSRPATIATSTPGDSFPSPPFTSRHLSDSAPDSAPVSPLPPMADVRNRRVIRQMFDPGNLIMLAHLTYWMFVLQFYLSTANIQLGVMTGANELETVAQERRAAGDAADDDTDFAAKLEAAESSRALWTSVLGWIIPWAWLVTLCVASLMNRKGVVAGYCVQHTFGLLHCALAATMVLAVQPLTFVLYATALDALYAVYITFIGLEYGFEHSSTLGGWLFLVSGAPLLLINPLLEAILEWGAPFQALNLVFLGGGCVASLSVLWLQRYEASKRGGGGGGERGVGAPPAMIRRGISMLFRGKKRGCR